MRCADRETKKGLKETVPKKVPYAVADGRTKAGGQVLRRWGSRGISMHVLDLCRGCWEELIAYL